MAGMLVRRARSALALARSVRVYHFDRARHRAMDALLGRFVRPGDLAFDIGAHVGDRVSSFRRLGARVVAVEPQPGPARILSLLHGRDPQVRILQVALGPCEGEAVLHVNSANPTVSSASPDFVAAADGAPGWEGQVWDCRLTVPQTTLDRLIADHGRPAFTKIDVEGFEDQVLAGLGAPVPALSFEFTTIQREAARACLERLERLGYRHFDYALGESHRLVLGEPVGAQAMARVIAALPAKANSGDVYAMFEPGRRD